MAQYRYEPLSPKLDEIRLLRLLPTSAPDSSDLECEVFVTRDSDSQHYNALSYCWGDAEKPCHINIKGARLAITISLHEALTQLRTCGLSAPLWVDAVCINQDDSLEKSHQVARMGNIYRRAKCVFAWLGPAGNDSDRAMEWIQDVALGAKQLSFGVKDVQNPLKIHGYLSAHRSHRNSARGDIAAPQNETFQHVAPSMSVGNDIKEERASFISRLYESTAEIGQMDHTLVFALEILLWREYWSRSWVLQEIYNAREVYFMCGTRTVDESSLHVAFGILLAFQEYNIIHLHLSIFPEFGTFNANTILKIRAAGLAGERIPLVYLLRQFRRSKSHLREDKVYSLLGIATDASELGIVPDYAMGTRQGLIAIAQTLLLAGYTEILTLCNDLDRLPGLPSWVPDWGNLSPQAFLCQRFRNGLGVTILQPEFTASGDVPCTIKDGSDHHPEALIMTGILVGTIRKLGNSFYTAGSNKWLEEILTFCPRASGDPMQRLRAACATAVGDQKIRRGHSKPRLDPDTLQRVCDCIARSWPEDLLGHLREKGLSEYAQQLWQIARGRKPMQVDEDYVGLAPEHAKVGDEIYVIGGAMVPYLFRKVPASETFQLVGEAYVHGVMDGEAADIESSSAKQIIVI